MSPPTSNSSRPKNVCARCRPPTAPRLLLTAVEGFSLNEAGKILGESPEEVEQAIVQAQHAIERQLASRVLIIEDESIIALDLENLVAELGHKVVGSAATKDEAVAKARAKKPGLVLADINLGEGGSGIDAVTEILRTLRYSGDLHHRLSRTSADRRTARADLSDHQAVSAGDGSGDDRSGPVLPLASPRSRLSALSINLERRAGEPSAPLPRSFALTPSI